jgi:hypothetical protein
MEVAYRISLKSLARCYLELHDEIADLNTMIAAIVDELAPNLVVRNSIGHRGAAQLLLTARDNPQRLRSEAAFAALCGVSPVPASSGKTARHRLNRGGDRVANSALHILAIRRLRTDTRTQAYVAKRIGEGHSKLERFTVNARNLRQVRKVSGIVARCELGTFIRHRPKSPVRAQAMTVCHGGTFVKLHDLAGMPHRRWYDFDSDPRPRRAGTDGGFPKIGNRAPHSWAAPAGLVP